MAGNEKTAVQPTRMQDFPAWYQEVIRVADLAEHAPVRGCMIIKPYGYALWENTRNWFDKEFQKRGVQNAYFPLFIPLSFLQREAEHVAGFAKEVAVVTHSRLVMSEGGLVPADPLEEPLIVRPTSEMIIGDSFAKWIQSHRDLPLKINQWANVVRWEMRPRLFLRTSEFLWQEGHTAHASGDEARATALEMLEVYREFAEEVLAIPVFAGRKTESEKFPGAETTYTLEAIMQDGKALQLCTSHYMGTNFAQAQSIRFQDADENLSFAHTTSWGLTTRTIGAAIMVHGDDNGVRFPPKIAPIQVMIIPFLLGKEEDGAVLDAARALLQVLSGTSYFEGPVRVRLDEREMRAGDKSWDAVKKGIPIRIEVGARDLQEKRIPVYLRNREKRDVIYFPDNETLAGKLSSLLEEIHADLYQRAVSYREKYAVIASDVSDIEQIFKVEGFPNPFVLAPYKEDRNFEEVIRTQFGVTIRCILHKNLPLSLNSTNNRSGDREQAIFARSY